MRIAHIIQSLDPAGGGPPGVAARIAAAQASLGHEVALLSTRAEGREADVQRSLQRVPGIGNVRLMEIPAGSTRQAWLGRRYIPMDAAGRLGEADVLHCHGVWDNLLLASARLVAGRTAYVFRPAGMLDPWSLAQSRWKKRVAMALHFRRLLNGVAFIHALNADEARLIGPLGLRAPVEVVPNGIFIDEIEPLPQRGAFRGQHPSVGDKPMVLFLSRLHYKKGLDILADAWRQVHAAVPEAVLVVAGPDEGAEADFRRRVREAGLDDSVLLTGPLYGKAKYEAMVDADLFCLPSRQEGFSVAITEALACGLPVVVTRECHFPEVATEGAGRVTALDAGETAEALVELLRSPRDRQKMGQAGAAMVRRDYTWPAVAARLIELYAKHTPGAGG